MGLGVCAAVAAVLALSANSTYNLGDFSTLGAGGSVRFCHGIYWHNRLDKLLCQHVAEKRLIRKRTFFAMRTFLFNRGAVERFTSVLEVFSNLGFEFVRAHKMHS